MKLNQVRAMLKESEEGREEDKRREVAVLDTMEMSHMSLTSKLRDKEQEVGCSIPPNPPPPSPNKRLQTLRIGSSSAEHGEPQNLETLNPHLSTVDAGPSAPEHCEARVRGTDDPGVPSCRSQAAATGGGGNRAPDDSVGQTSIPRSTFGVEH